MHGTTSINNSIVNPEQPEKMRGEDDISSLSKPQDVAVLPDGALPSHSQHPTVASSPPVGERSPPPSPPSRAQSLPSSPPFGAHSLPPSPLHREPRSPIGTGMHRLPLPLENNTLQPSPTRSASHSKALASPSQPVPSPLASHFFANTASQLCPTQSVKAVSVNPPTEGMAQKSKRKDRENEGNEGSPKRQKAGSITSGRPLRSIAETVHTLTSSSSTHPQPTHLSTANDSSKSSATQPSERRSHVISLPQDAPLWIRNALVMLESEDLGPQWTPLVDAWFKYEEKHAFGKGTQLGAQGRPWPIGRWIQLARKKLTAEQARDAGMDGFEDAFWSWWIGLQPTWRKISASATSREIGGSWVEIDKHGVNGLLSVVAALYIWCLHGSGQTSWACAVDDVCWVLTQLA